MFPTDRISGLSGYHSLHRTGLTRGRRPLVQRRASSSGNPPVVRREALWGLLEGLRLPPGAGAGERSRGGGAGSRGAGCGPVPVRGSQRHRGVASWELPWSQR